MADILKRTSRRRGESAYSPRVALEPDEAAEGKVNDRAANPSALNSRTLTTLTRMWSPASSSQSVLGMPRDSGNIEAAVPIFPIRKVPVAS